MGPIIISAVAYDNVIGNKGGMPWGRLPIDLKHFQEATMGHAVVMGYKTFVSLGKPLAGRRNIILTSHPEKLSRFNGDIGITKNVDSIIEISKRRQTFIIGGENVYRQFIELPETRTMYITRIHARFHGDTFFPEFSHEKWHMIQSESHAVCEKNKYSLTFEKWVRN